MSEPPMTNRERSLAAIGSGVASPPQTQRTDTPPAYIAKLDRLQGLLRSATDPDAFIDALTQDQLVRLHRRMVEAVEAAKLEER